MTNEEYRQYVHKMYVDNFVSKGKTPKYVQVFGDSYGHFANEGTWPYELSKILGCPAISFAAAGGNNLRTLSYFHQYYDEECLNIVLFTGPLRMYIDDDMFMLQTQILDDNHPNKVLGYNQFSISEERKASIINAAKEYYTHIHRGEIEKIVDLQLVKAIFDLKNVIVLSCFNNDWNGWRRKEMFPTTVSDKFLEFYDFKIPQLFNTCLLSITFLQFLPEQYRNGTLLEFDWPNESIKDNCRDDYLDFARPFYDSLTGKHMADVKNHISKGAQIELSKMLGDILLTGKGNIELQKINRPSDEERTSFEVWHEEKKHRRKMIEELNIPLLSRHKFWNDND